MGLSEKDINIRADPFAFQSLHDRKHIPEGWPWCQGCLSDCVNEVAAGNVVDDDLLLEQMKNGFCYGSDTISVKCYEFFKKYLFF